MTIETKHGEHKIRYDEESNTWQCRAMKCSAATLGALRTKLNAEDREDRRLDGLRVFSTDSGWEGDEAEVIITMIDTSHHGVNGHRVGSTAKKRDYFSLGTLVVLNDKNAPKIKNYKDAIAAYSAAEEALDAARNALPHPTIEELKKLSKT